MRNSDGFNLLQLIVGMAIMSIVALFTFVAPDMVMKTHQTYNRIRDFADLKRQVRTLLHNEDQCRCNFKFKAADPIAKNFKFPVAPPATLTLNAQRIKYFTDVDNCSEGPGDQTIASTISNNTQDDLQVKHIYLGRIYRLGQSSRYRAVLYMLAESRRRPGQSQMASFGLVFNSSIDSNEAAIDSCQNARGL